MTISKNRTTTLKVALAVLLLAPLPLTSCNDAQIASSNLSRAADNFEIMRRVVFLNGITDTYLLSIEGLCAIEDQGRQLEVTCAVGPREYKKHFLGLSDNVTYFAEQAGRRTREHLPLPGRVQAADDRPGRRLPGQRTRTHRELVRFAQMNQKPADNHERMAQLENAIERIPRRPAESEHRRAHGALRPPDPTRAPFTNGPRQPTRRGAGRNAGRAAESTTRSRE